MTERLQKVMAGAGLGSRRACEELIRQGRVTVNGKVAALGCKVDPDADEVRVDGEQLRSAEKRVYVALYKPVGVLSSLRSQGGRPTVRDLLDMPQRVYPVGRLDLESEGLILLTNDGDLAHRLSHPSFGAEKEYRVLPSRRPDETKLEAWRRGVVIADGTRTRPAQVWREAGGRDSAWIRVILREGRKRQIREVAKALGFGVRRLIRVRLGGLELGSMAPGEWRKLTPAEIRSLRSSGPGKSADLRRSDRERRKQSHSPRSQEPRRIR